MRAKLLIALSALAAMAWAVPSAGAAHFFAVSSGNPAVSPPAAPAPARLEVERERGLLLRVWLNHKGPYVFAVDTGAGVNLIAQRTVAMAQLPVSSVRQTLIGGLSSARTTSTRQAAISNFSVGSPENALTSPQKALVVANLPPGVDGVLNPTQAYSPYGFSIDITNERIEALPAGGLKSSMLLKRGQEGARVAWLRSGEDDRPFVKLGDGRIALVDTGSRFGLAVSDRNAVIVGRNGERLNYDVVRDVGGGSISSRRVSPTTISIGELVLRGVPTDILFGAEKGTPLILGRDALYPFRVSFDPQAGVIEFVTVSEE